MSSGLRYFMVGNFPVKFVPTPSGGLAVLELNLITGEFQPNLDRYDEVYSRGAKVDNLSEDEFIQRVERIRARRLRGDGPVFALYELMNGIEDLAKEQNRSLAPDETALLASLRRESYARFQAEHPDPVSRA